MFADECMDIALAAIVGVAPPAARWVQLHVGEPGNGTANVARNATRKAATFTHPIGAMSVSAGGLGWFPVEVVAQERYTHFTVWDAPRGGSSLWDGLLKGSGVDVGDEYHITAGSLAVGFD